MKIYYSVPEARSEFQEKLMQLLLENFKLKLMWQLRHLEMPMKDENGCIFIDHANDEIDLRFEGFSDPLIGKIRESLAGMKYDRV